jgi:hypothetical protein
MNEGDSDSLVFLHQAEMNELGGKAQNFANQMISEHDKFSVREIVRAIYAGCLAAADEISIFAYKEALEGVEDYHPLLLKNAREGFKRAEVET